MSGFVSFLRGLFATHAPPAPPAPTAPAPAPAPTPVAPTSVRTRVPLTPADTRAMQSRGYRNKNPGNIDWSARNKWQGQAGIEATGNPPRFAVFQTHEFGIRALARLLITYQDRHDLKTIRGIISRWAPPNENSTGGYVRFVDDFLPNHTADDPINVHRYADARLLVEAIIRKELGGCPYPPEVIDAGLRLAGVVPDTTK